LSTGSKFRCVASTCLWTNVSLLAKKRGWQETVFQAFKNKARNLWIGAPAKREINKTLTLCGFCGALQICINTMATPTATAATTRSCSSNNWHNAPLTMQHVVVVACSLACCELCSEFYLFVFPGPVPATHQPTNSTYILHTCRNNGDNNMAGPLSHSAGGQLPRWFHFIFVAQKPKQQACDGPAVNAIF